MPKPPFDLEALAQNIETSTNSILAPTSPSTQDIETRSPNLSLQDSERSLYQPLPHVDELTKQQWTKERSLKLDFWLLYCELEFQVKGRQA